VARRYVRRVGKGIVAGVSDGCLKLKVKQEGTSMPSSVNSSHWQPKLSLATALKWALRAPHAAVNIVP
jgi:hypothetical protein